MSRGVSGPVRSGLLPGVLAAALFGSRERELRGSRHAGVRGRADQPRAITASSGENGLGVSY